MFPIILPGPMFTSMHSAWRLTCLICKFMQNIYFVNFVYLTLQFRSDFVLNKLSNNAVCVFVLSIHKFKLVDPFWMFVLNRSF